MASETTNLVTPKDTGWKQFLDTIEVTVVAGFASFAGSIGAISGGALDGSHLKAAGVAAAIAAAYKLAGMLNAAKQ